MSEIKGGRKPLSAKKARVNINPDEVFTNRLKLPADAAREAEENGWELRWVDAQQMVLNGGQHKNGWIPYKRTEKVDDDYGFKLGNDPEGIIRRTSLILAWRPKHQGDKHRAFLKNRADNLSTAFQKGRAESLRRDAAQAGLDAEIHEGFDENED